MSCVQSSQCQAIPFTGKFGVRLLCLYFKLGFAEIKLTKHFEQHDEESYSKVRRIAPTKQESFCMCLFVSQGKVWVEGLFWQTPTRNHAEIAGRCFVWFIPDDLLHFWGPFFFGGGGVGRPIQTPLKSNNMWLNMSLGLQQLAFCFIKQMSVSSIFMFWKVPFVGNNHKRSWSSEPYLQKTKTLGGWMSSLWIWHLIEGWHW